MPIGDRWQKLLDICHCCHTGARLASAYVETYRHPATVPNGRLAMCQATVRLNWSVVIRQGLLSVKRVEFRIQTPLQQLGEHGLRRERNPGHANCTPFSKRGAT
jgi:hypothetical protein